MTEWEMFQYYLDYVKSYFNNMKTWSEQDKLKETIRAIEKEIQRLRDEGVIN